MLVLRFVLPEGTVSVHGKKNEISIPCSKPYILMGKGGRNGGGRGTVRGTTGR